ncbi:uncharacterized protein LOC123666239 [Melitaea cinxia]|uniref:uncharacterized protein LOC123666239 n=1 Tax=Melitaea cinxia TaxID=113334 RepID=UPI001E270CFD|nr:uncharacterized protein LOC123666239 [Melitaea cinxia]
MAFSFRKMLSNINYFKKTEECSDSVPDDANFKLRRHASDETILLDFECLEPDSTSRQCASLKLPESVKNYAVKKGSLSDTDLLTRTADTPLRSKKRKCKKLKLDIKKASCSMNQLSADSFNNAENTPKHVLLDCKSPDLFSERFKEFHFNRSFELLDALSDEVPSSPFELDIDSLSDDSESGNSEFSALSNKSSIKMCRKVTASQSSNEQRSVPSTSIESFGDVDVEKNEEERVRLLETYQFKLAKMDDLLKKFLHEFRFHIEVSRLFYSKSILSANPNTDIKDQKNFDQIYLKECTVRSESPVRMWNIVMEKEDTQTKAKMKKQLLSIKSNIERFTSNYLKIIPEDEEVNHKSIKFDLNKQKKLQKRPKNVNYKKKMKHFDFPDLRDAMLNLFTEEMTNDLTLSDSEYSNICQCMCKCHTPSTPTSQTDSGMLTKTNDGSMSITSSIGNFSLDSSTLTAYSETLEQVVSYNSFQDTSLYNSLLQKAAIERITFYVQVHSIQLKCEEYDEQKSFTFHCPSCKDTLQDENSLLRHILSQSHCEKIHFVYKTAYIKKCMSSGKEIQPSTVLNSMTMYRDENKIVCFGDAMYACSLCFENFIVGESVLMAHCYDPQHVEKRSKLDEIIG